MEIYARVVIWSGPHSVHFSNFSKPRGVLFVILLHFGDVFTRSMGDRIANVPIILNSYDLGRFQLLLKLSITDLAVPANLIEWSISFVLLPPSYVKRKVLRSKVRHKRIESSVKTNDMQVRRTCQNSIRRQAAYYNTKPRSYLFPPIRLCH